MIRRATLRGGGTPRFRDGPLSSSAREQSQSVGSFLFFFPKGEEISRRPRPRREHCHGTARLAAGNSAGAGRGSSCVLFDFVGMNDGTAAAVAPFCRAATRRASRREWIYQALTALQGNVPAALAEP